MPPQTADTVPEDAPEHCPVSEALRVLQQNDDNTVELLLTMTRSFKRELRAIKLAKPMPVQDAQIRMYAQRHRRDLIQISLISQSEWLLSNIKS
jgi:hypothetical protein